MTQKNGLYASFLLLVLIILPVCFFNIPVFRENILTLHSKVWLLLSIITILLLACSSKYTKERINYFDIAYFVFIIYGLLRTLLLPAYDVTVIANSVLFFLLYYALKKQFIHSDGRLTEYALLLGHVLVFIVTFLVVIVQVFWSKQTDDLFVPNKSIYSILLASQLIFLAPYIISPFASSFFMSNTSLRIILCGIYLMGLPLLVFLNGRSGWAGFCVALLFVVYQYSYKRSRKAILISGVVVFATGSPALISYKSNSSAGRLLIYKVSANMLQDNWLFGTGNGRFKVAYNEFQAAYFQSGNIDSREALLADKTYYCFNDFFQVFIENGLAGLVILGFGGFFLLQQISRLQALYKHKPMVIGSIGSLICLLIGSLFSYPLQLLPLLLPFTVFLSVIHSYSAVAAIRL